MKPGFTVDNMLVGMFRKKSFVITVANYPMRNEVINWGSAHRGDRTGSDVGIWRVKIKRHAQIS